MTDQAAETETRVRMLEEITRGQEKQLAMLVSNDDRRVSVDQENTLVIARLADALQHLREDANQNRSLILEKVDDKFKALTLQIDGLHGQQVDHGRRLDEHGVLLLEHSGDIKGIRETVGAHAQALEEQGKAVADHASAWKVARWCLAATWAIFAAAVIALIAHWIGQIK